MENEGTPLYKQSRENRTATPKRWGKGDFSTNSWSRRDLDALVGCGVKVIALAVLGIVTLGGGIVSCRYINNVEYSTGSRVGVINKLSRKGLFWQTEEGEMVLRGIRNQGDSIGANIWRFSLDNEERHGEDKEGLISDIERYMEDGTTVRVEYVEPVYTWPWRSKTDYLVQSIKPLEQDE